MSRPPVSNATPLPTRVTFGALSCPQVKSMSRGAVAEARPTAWIIGKFCFSSSIADDAAERGAVPLGEMARRGLDPVGAEVVGRRVDEVAAEDDRLGDACHLVRIDAVRHREPDGLRRAGAVAVEVVAAEEPREGRERRIVGRVLEAIDALGQDAGQLAGEERVVACRYPSRCRTRRRGCRHFGREAGSGSRFRLKALRDGEGPRGRRQRRRQSRPSCARSRARAEGAVRSARRGVDEALRLARWSAPGPARPVNAPLGLILYGLAGSGGSEPLSGVSCHDASRAASPSCSPDRVAEMGRRRARRTLDGRLPEAKGAADITGSIPNPQQATPEIWRRQSDIWGPRFEANPADPMAALSYAQALRALDQKPAGGRSPAAGGDPQPEQSRAPRRLRQGAGRCGALQGGVARSSSRAHTPERPDWRILSAQGAVADQTGDHVLAQQYYESALKLVPEEPSVLSNLGLSYALTKRLADAERVLRQAAANPEGGRRACGRTWRSSLASRASIRTPKRSSSRISRPTRRPPTMADLRGVAQAKDAKLFVRKDKPAKPTAE